MKMRVAKKVVTRWWQADSLGPEGASHYWPYRGSTWQLARVRHDRRGQRNLRQAIRTRWWQASSRPKRFNFRWTVDRDSWVRGPAFNGQ